MTGFTIFYGCLYLFFGIWIYRIYSPAWPWWGASLMGLICVVALHFSLALFGHLSMLHHQSKKRKKLEKEEKSSINPD